MKKFFPIVTIFAVTCLIFFKIFTRGQYPIPGDLLVSFYFPYYSGAWEGYDPWTTRKELLGADSIRQIYLWKEFAAEQFKQGSIPLWNPYTFSGQPLLANLQSSVFYPLNIFYYLADPANAWIVLIILQPFLGGIFMYLCARSFRIEKIPSLFASLGFMFSSYLITWMENGNIAHSYIWLPTSIWAINSFFEKPKFRYVLFLIISLVLAILAGHPQTAIYIFAAVGIFWLYKIGGQKLKIQTILTLALVFAVSLTLSAVQLIPTYLFHKISPVSLTFSKEVFEKGLIPAQNFITLFASDFFGHPANNNFWSQSYGDFTPYIGVIPLFFALWAAVCLWKNRFVKFAFAISLIFILASTKSPISQLTKILQIPILDSTSSARFMSISIFFLLILSALGLQDLLKNYKENRYFKKFIKFSSVLLLVYLAMWAFALFGAKFLKPTDIWQTNLAVTKRNLILPTFMFLCIPAGVFALRISAKIKSLKNLPLKNLFVAGIFAATIVGGIYYSNKFLPTAPKKFIFPDHLLFTWINQNAGINRFYGAGTAHIDFNFPTHYQIYAIEGYDTLRIERYAQLLASSFTGSVPQIYLRSDAVVPNIENGYRKRIFELLGVKYLLDKEDNPKTGADWHYERFQGDKVQGYWQNGKFQIYIRENSLPRIFQTTKYTVADDAEIISKIYDPNFNLETLLLEKEPQLSISTQSTGITVPQIVEYKPGSIKIKTESNNNSLLFISDAYDPDWIVEIDNQKSKLLRAHYALTAVAVPAGTHDIAFSYQPQSFRNGVIISFSAMAALLLVCAYMISKKRF